MKKIKNVQDLIDLGFKDVAHGIVENKKFATSKLREDGSFSIGKRGRAPKGKGLARILEPNTGEYFRLDEGVGIYVIEVNGEIWRSGKASGKNAMVGRLNSYLSGNPAYNENENGKPTNASTNRNSYSKLKKCVKEGGVVRFLYRPIPVKIEKENVLGEIKNVKKFAIAEWEEKLYDLFELPYTPNGKPLGNKEKKAYGNKEKK